MIGLVLLMAGAVLSAIGYIHKSFKKSDRERQREIENLDERLSSLESNLYGHEQGSEGYIVSTEAEFRKINEKLDDMQKQMEREHIEAKTLLAEVIQWIDEQNGDELDVEYEKTVELLDREDD